MSTPEQRLFVVRWTKMATGTVKIMADSAEVAEARIKTWLAPGDGELTTATAEAVDDLREVN